MRWALTGGDRSLAGFVLVCATALGTFGACGGSTISPSACDSREQPAASGGDCNPGTSGGGGDAGEAAGSGVGGSSASGGHAGAIVLGGTSGQGPSDAAPDPIGCAALAVHPVRLDLFILLDRSGSMALGVDRWTPVTNAIKTLVETPEMEGHAVGLGYFGLHLPGVPPDDPLAPVSCSPGDYARPDVPIEALPGARQAIFDSLGLHTTPSGGTPTRPALEGTLQYASQWAGTHAGSDTMVVLMTDGAPQGCTDNDLDTVSRAAAAAMAASPPVRTYVIGIGDVPGLDAIAQAGGTSAFMVPDSNLSQGVLDALKEIMGPVTPCSITIPPVPEGSIDFDKINVQYRTASGTALIEYVQRAQNCQLDRGGWYYVPDTGETPRSIALCPASCAAVAIGGDLQISLGCDPGRPIPPERSR